MDILRILLLMLLFSGYTLLLYADGFVFFLILVANGNRLFREGVLLQ